MKTLQVASTNGKSATVDESQLEQFHSSLHGELLLREDSGYDDARVIWNAMIDKRPAMIARCMGAEDVVTAVNFSREHRLLTAVRGVGHNIAGNAVCDDGLVIDLTSMKSVTVDPKTARAAVGPGATLGDFDKAVQAHGLVTPLGINSTTGIAGLTLGGGFGWLSRKYGMLIDNLASAEVVTAEGRLVKASSTENPELFWAIRGGGGNFGVVTQFEFQLHKLEHDVISGLVVYSLEEGEKVLRAYREYAAEQGDDTSVWAVLRPAPPLPFLPVEVHGKGVVAFALFHAGDPEDGKKILEPVRHFGTVLGEHVGAQPYLAWQTAFDPLLTEGARNYWKTHNFGELTDGAIDLAVRYAREAPSSQCEIFFAHLGGAINRVAVDATAYSHRNVEFLMNVHARWDKSQDDEACIGWARRFFKDMAPHATGTAYTNFMTGDEGDRISEAYGTGYERLIKAKQKYDPENLFRLNQNIKPTR